jgi:hypothetical protein
VEPDDDSFLEAGGAGGAATGAGTNFCSEREDEPVEAFDDSGAESSVRCRRDERLGVESPDESRRVEELEVELLEVELST